MKILKNFQNASTLASQNHKFHKKKSYHTKQGYGTTWSYFYDLFYVSFSTSQMEKISRKDHLVSKYNQEKRLHNMKEKGILK
jgi:hypothetical protein